MKIVNIGTAFVTYDSEKTFIIDINGDEFVCCWSSLDSPHAIGVLQRQLVQHYESPYHTSQALTMLDCLITIRTRLGLGT